MSDFICTECNVSFSIPAEVLDRYPGWTPRFCRKHSPGSKSTQHAGQTTAGRGNGTKGNGQSIAAKKRPRRTTTIEENIVVAEVLRRYSGGPKEGIFTDGGCTPNPGAGGWGCVWVENDDVKLQKYGKEAETTNNRMEMTAIIAAFEMLPNDVSTILYSDSKLCIDTLNTWAKGWERNGWKRKTGPIKNLDLVQRAWSLKKEHPGVRLQHIRAHSGERWNEYADALASAWQREVL